MRGRLCCFISFQHIKMNRASSFFDAVDRATEVVVLRVVPMVLKVVAVVMVLRWVLGAVGSVLWWIPK
jgi:hypothetical protein